MNAGPATASSGTVNVNSVELTSVSGIFGFPAGFNPPRLTVFPACVLNRLITVSVENPVPSTVTVLPLWVTLVTLIRAPSGTDTASLLALYVPPAALLTMIDPGPVGVVAGRVKVIESGLRPALPALRNWSSACRRFPDRRRRR